MLPHMQSKQMAKHSTNSDILYQVMYSDSAVMKVLGLIGDKSLLTETIFIFTKHTILF